MEEQVPVPARKLVNGIAAKCLEVEGHVAKDEGGDPLGMPHGIIDGRSDEAGTGVKDEVVEGQAIDNGVEVEKIVLGGVILGQAAGRHPLAAAVVLDKTES